MIRCFLNVFPSDASATKSSTSPSANANANNANANNGGSATNTITTKPVIEPVRPNITVNQLAVAQTHEKPKRISFVMDGEVLAAEKSVEEKVENPKINENHDDSKEDKEEDINPSTEDDKSHCSGPCSPCSVCDGSSDCSGTGSADEEDYDEDDDDDGEEEAKNEPVKCNGGIGIDVESKMDYAESDLETQSDKKDCQMRLPAAGIPMKGSFKGPTTKAKLSNPFATLPRNASSSNSTTRLLDSNSQGAASSSRFSLNSESPRHLVTYVTSSLETVPLEISQDIPDVLL